MCITYTRQQCSGSFQHFLRIRKELLSYFPSTGARVCHSEREKLTGVMT
jgi:hypothetical protein